MASSTNLEVPSDTEAAQLRSDSQGSADNLRGSPDIQAAEHRRGSADSLVGHRTLPAADSLGSVQSRVERGREGRGGCLGRVEAWGDRADHLTGGMSAGDRPWERLRGKNHKVHQPIVYSIVSITRLQQYIVIDILKTLLDIDILNLQIIL